jgi:hypothetical protein
MERGRPNKGTRRQRSRTCSESNTQEAKPDLWKLPGGQRAIEASVTYHPDEKDDLNKQALEQAEKFEVLHKRDVSSLSRVSFILHIIPVYQVAYGTIRNFEPSMNAVNTFDVPTNHSVRAARSSMHG